MISYDFLKKIETRENVIIQNKRLRAKIFKTNTFKKCHELNLKK